MTKNLIIFLYFLCIYSIESTKNNGFHQKNLLFTADFKDSEEFIFDVNNDYIKLSVAKDRPFSGRSTLPLCFAVGCTKTALICEQKNGKMITTFRSVNDTRQAYFTSSLVNEDMVLTVNCREAHIACCFEGPKNLNAVVMPALRPASPPKPTVPSLSNPVAPISSLPQPPKPQVNKPSLPTYLLSPLRPIPPSKPLQVNRPTILLTPLKYLPHPYGGPKPPKPISESYPLPMKAPEGPALTNYKISKPTEPYPLPVEKPLVPEYATSYEKPVSESTVASKPIPLPEVVPTEPIPSYEPIVGYTRKALSFPSNSRINSIHRIHEMSSKTNKRQKVSVPTTHTDLDGTQPKSPALELQASNNRIDVAFPAALPPPETVVNPLFSAQEFFQEKIEPVLTQQFQNFGKLTAQPNLKLGKHEPPEETPPPMKPLPTYPTVAPMEPLPTYPTKPHPTYPMKPPPTYPTKLLPNYPMQPLPGYPTKPLPIYPPSPSPTYTTTPKLTTTTTPPPTTTKAPTTTKGPPLPPSTLPTPPPPIPSSNRPIKVYLFSNICMGFLGGAGFVDCNG